MQKSNGNTAQKYYKRIKRSQESEPFVTSVGVQLQPLAWEKVVFGCLESQNFSEALIVDFFGFLCANQCDVGKQLDLTASSENGRMVQQMATNVLVDNSKQWYATQNKVTDQWLQFEFQDVVIPLMSIMLQGPTWESDRDEFPKDIRITFINGGRKVASLDCQTIMPKRKNFSQRLDWNTAIYCSSVRLDFKNNHGRKDWLGAINRLDFFASKCLCDSSKISIGFNVNENPELVQQVFYGEPWRVPNFFDINSVEFN